MSKFLRFFAIAALIAGALALTPGPAAAQWHGGHGGWHGGGWRGGGWGRGWGPGLVFGFGPGWGWGYPYSYYDGYYGAPNCGWAPVRVFRHGYWGYRRAWRCW
jgi:hypothetical protein